MTIAKFEKGQSLPKHLPQHLQLKEHDFETNGHALHQPIAQNPKNFLFSFSQIDLSRAHINPRKCNQNMYHFLFNGPQLKYINLLLGNSIETNNIHVMLQRNATHFSL